MEQIVRNRSENMVKGIEHILFFPLTMISKRIERDEVVNVQALFCGICNNVAELIGE